jgi:hypothetical protein
MRSARVALLARDTQAARSAARDAFRQQRTFRAAIAVAGLYLSPAVLSSIHPAKNRVYNAVLRAQYRMSRRQNADARD